MWIPKWTKKCLLLNFHILHSSLCIHLSMHSSIRLSKLLSIYLSINLSTHLSIYLSKHYLYIYLSILSKHYLCIFLYVYVYILLHICILCNASSIQDGGLYTRVDRHAYVTGQQHIRFILSEENVIYRCLYCRRTLCIYC